MLERLANLHKILFLILFLLFLFFLHIYHKAAHIYKCQRTIVQKNDLVILFQYVLNL